MGERASVHGVEPTLHDLEASKGASTPLDSETLPLVAEELAVTRAALERSSRPHG